MNKKGPNDEGSSRVLIADDDPVTVKMLSHYLEDAGMEVVTAKDGKEAMAKMSPEISVALFDLAMPRASGLECVRFVRANFSDASVLVVSGTGEIKDAVEAMKEGAFDYITKPFERDELVARVQQASNVSKLSAGYRSLREAVNLAPPSCDFVAAHPLTQQLLQRVNKVATLDSTVLITGESGTGKTTIARLIHQMGPRSEGPFVTVNCASLPRDLVEAELFGHEKGAFTGALNARPGRAEIADGGTLFLDEIGDLPLELQPKLLTFLQDRTLQRIGSNKMRSVDVRLIAATHQDLATMCSERHFREDLYYRLNVITLHVPALRERPDDIPHLAQQVLNRIGRQRSEPPRVCDQEAVDVLLKHDWRGNVRELENVMERASAFSEKHELGVEDLMFPKIPGASSSSDVPEPTPQTLAGRTLGEIEAQAITDTLAACGGNKAEAARRLGISEKGIYNKMKRFNLRGDSSEE